MLNHEWFASAGIIAKVVVGFGFLIFIHEFGHFIVAKWKGVKVIKFSLGFGPALLQYKLGETIYALSIVPLGGYCKLAGEMDSAGVQGKEGEEAQSGEPPEDPNRLLTSKSILARAQIFAAGAIMNLLAAFPLAVLALVIGGPVEITKVRAGSESAYIAGIANGDTIVSVNGTPVHFWDELTTAIEHAPVGTPFPVTVVRDDKTLVFQVTRGNKDDLLGVDPYLENVIGGVMPGVAWKAGLKSGDKILSVAKEGQPPVQIKEWGDFQSITESSPGEKLTIQIERKGKTLTKVIAPGMVPNDGTDGLKKYAIGVDLAPEPVVGAVQKGSPAEAGGLKPEDRIISVNGKPVESGKQAHQAIRTAGPRLAIQVTRNGETVDLTIERRSAQELIGVVFSRLVVGSVKKNSPAEKAGIKPGDAIVKVDGKPFEQEDLIFPDSNDHSLELKRDAELVTVTLKPERLYSSKIGAFAQPASEFRRTALLPAITEGVTFTAGMIGRTVKVLYHLVAGRISTNQLAGPVGIISISYQGAQSGWQHFIRILMLISISLGIFNLLPVPVLDGGHLFFLAIEKIKGKPVSERTFVVAQYVGLVLLIGLVLYVTGNDVMRFIL